MARNIIMKKDGSPSQYFWSDRDGKQPTERTVYKQTDTGVKRMTGVHYNADTRRIQKD